MAKERHGIMCFRVHKVRSETDFRALHPKEAYHQAGGKLVSRWKPVGTRRRQGSYPAPAAYDEADAQITAAINCIRLDDVSQMCDAKRVKARVFVSRIWS